MSLTNPSFPEQGTVDRGGQLLSPFLDLQALTLGNCPSHKPAPDVINRLGAGMDHVRGVKTVVPQLVHEYLVSREVVGSLRKSAGRLFYREKQDAFTELVPMCSVFEVTDRGDRENEAFVREPSDHIAQ